MCGSLVLCSVTEQTTEGPNEAVVTLLALTNQQKIYVSFLLDGLGFEEWVNFVFFVIAKDVDAQVVLTLYAWNVLQRNRIRNPFHVELVFKRSVVVDSIRISRACKVMKTCQNTPEDALLIIILNVQD